MAVGPAVAVLRDIQTLYDAGTAGGLTDRQLLERFIQGRGGSGEAAFEALVLRHGPMVLRVCHNVLGDATDAQDAFQATFLVLVGRCHTIRQLESIGGWLYGVACRVAARARVDAARRRAAERRGGLRLIDLAESARAGIGETEEFGPAVQEEVRRLPDRYRAVVALCYWEGLTHEQAAAHLGCPLGTVRSRLARARDLLHRRLTRRGVQPLAGLVAARLEDATSPAGATARRLAPVPPELVHWTVRAGTQVASGKTLAEAASGLVSTLTRDVIRSMIMIKVCKSIAAFCIVGLFVIGVTLWAQQPRDPRPRPRSGTRSEQPARESPKTVKKIAGPTLVVEPPDLVLVEVLEAMPGRPISGERLVRPDGSISLGFYGDVHVAGLTVPEIKEKIIEHLRKYISDNDLGLLVLDQNGDEVIDPSTNQPKQINARESAAVFVDVTAYNSQIYYIEGDVVTPSRFPVTGGETVLDALHFAGGLLPSADQTKVRLIRSYPKGAPVQVLAIDYAEITMGTNASTNYRILPNDRLVVPRDARHGQSSGEMAENVRLPQPGTEDLRKQLETLHAVERHLKDVERKLDRLLEETDRGTGQGQRKPFEKRRLGPGRMRSAAPETDSP
jgi:polysaccharide biosynthesis/export protein